MDSSLLDCEQHIEDAMAEHATAQCPPLLAQALNYAVFPGGARVRPQLCKAVALAKIPAMSDWQARRLLPLSFYIVHR